MSEKAGWGFDEGDEIQPGRYVLDKLGGGKRYEVYIAWDDKLFSQVVAKLVRPDQVEDPRALSDLTREFDTISGLSHPMLVRSFGLVADGRTPHLVLEHFEGPTLRRLVKGYGPLPLEQLVPLAIKVCGALHYMATESVVHLDVKPTNIVMEAPPKLIDLSVARPVDAARKLKKRVGTRKYMAPEQIDPGRMATIGPATDVWGAGVTLYEAAVGERPFSPPASDDDFPQLDAEPNPPPKEIPPRAADLLVACLRKDPAERPSAAEVARGFEPLLEAIPERPRLRRTRPKLR